MSEAQQGFDGREGAVPAGRRQIAQGISELLQVGEGNLPERLPCPNSKALDVGAVGSLGMDGAAVEPDLQELIVGSGARRVRKVFLGRGVEQHVIRRLSPIWNQ